mmetsp:Transcript_32701/g.45383  ORF Transcript_32701/g.45383 Transcript_32701/m.45383 type:complete len:262 (-) Transcript_32701:43-828(-)
MQELVHHPTRPLLELLPRSQLFNELHLHAGPNTQDAVFLVCVAHQDAAFCRLHRNHLEILILPLQEVAYAIKGSSCAHARHQIIHFAATLAPDLRPGGVQMGFGVVWVLELLGAPDCLVLGHQVFHVCQHTRHTLGWGCEVHLSAEFPTCDEALVERGKLRHHDDAFVALRCSSHGHADSSVSTGSFNNSGFPRCDRASLLSFLDYTLGDAVLHRTSWVLHLKFDKHVDPRSCAPLQLDHRSLTDSIQHAFDIILVDISTL